MIQLYVLQTLQSITNKKARTALQSKLWDDPISKLPQTFFFILYSVKKKIQNLMSDSLYTDIDDATDVYTISVKQLIFLHFIFQELNNFICFHYSALE